MILFASIPVKVNAYEYNRYVYILCMCIYREGVHNESAVWSRSK